MESHYNYEQTRINRLMKIIKDKYGRMWLKRYSTYTLLSICQTGVMNPKIEVGEVIIKKTRNK